MRKPGAMLLLILIGVSLPLWVGGWRTNLDALQAMAICAGTETNPLPEQPFLRGGAARCLGDESEMRQAYEAAVLAPDARLDVLRAVMPLDVELAREATIAHPGEAQAYFWFGDAIMVNLRMDFQAATDIDNDLYSAINEAVAAYESGLALDPTNALEWDKLGRVYQTAGDWKKAIHAFELACHYVDKGKNGCLNAARLYMVHEMYEQAAARYQDSLRQLPGYAPALRGLADALIAQGRQDEAIPYLEMLAAQGDASAQALLEQLKASP